MIEDRATQHASHFWSANACPMTLVWILRTHYERKHIQLSLSVFLNFEPDPEKVLYTVMLSSTELSVTGISNGWHTKLELSRCLVFALWLFFWRRTRDVAAGPHLPPATYRATSGSCRGYRGKARRSFLINPIDKRRSNFPTELRSRQTK